jgi:hypothetical protein
MPVRTYRAVAHGVEQRVAVGLIWLSLEFTVEVEVIPADDGVLDEPPAALSDFLILFLALNELLVVTVRDGPGEFIRALHLVQLLLDRLPELNVVDVF